MLDLYGGPGRWWPPPRRRRVARDRRRPGLNLPSAPRPGAHPVDTLSDPAKLTLKTAGVLGRTCARSVLGCGASVAGGRGRWRDVAGARHSPAGGCRRRAGRLLSQHHPGGGLSDAAGGAAPGTMAAAAVLEQVEPAAVAPLAHHFYHADLQDDGLRARALHYLDRCGPGAAGLRQRDPLHQVDRALGLVVDWTRLKRRVDLLHLLGRREEEAATLAQLAACVDALAQTVGLAQGDYFEAVSRYDDALAAVTQARHAAAGAGDRTAEARCSARLGMIRWRQGDHAAQLTLCSASSTTRPVTVAAEADTRTGWVSSTGSKASYAAAAAEFDRCLTSTVSRATVLPRPKRSLRWDTSRTIAMSWTPPWSRTSALAIYRETGDRAGVAHSLLSLGQVARSQGTTQNPKVSSIKHSRTSDLNDVWFEISAFLN
ncbi:MAG: hypothetical protein R2838_00105 [Caldilineaceae bacterium]